MSVANPEYPLPPEDQPVLEVATIALDTSLNLYLHACSLYAQKPTSATFDVLRRHVDLHADAFDTCIETIDNSGDADADEIIRICSTLVQRMDAARVSHVNKLTGRETLTPLEVGLELQQDQADDLEDYEKPHIDKNLLVSSIGETFRSILHSDTDLLLDAVGVSKAGRRAELQATLQRHALDVGKIALGTAIALIATRRWR